MESLNFGNIGLSVNSVIGDPFFTPFDSGVTLHRIFGEMAEPCVRLSMLRREQHWKFIKQNLRQIKESRRRCKIETTRRAISHREIYE